MCKCCSERTCDMCPMTGGDMLPVGHLRRQPVLAKLYGLFLQVASVSIQDPLGGITLSMMSCFLNGYPDNLGCTHKEFWTCMEEFLVRSNQKIRKEVKRANRGKDPGR